jgi:hypothetical protein
LTNEDRPSPLGGASPHAISNRPQYDRHKACLYRTSPKLAVIRRAPRTSLERLVPFGSVVLDAFGAVGIAAAAASLQGFSPFVGWGTLSPDFSACSVPGSPGIHPPWGIPLPDPWPLRCRAQPRDLDGNSECCLSQKTQTAAPAQPPWAFREGTLIKKGTVPCASSVKEQGSWLASHEAAGP